MIPAIPESARPKIQEWIDQDPRERYPHYELVVIGAMPRLGDVPSDLGGAALPTIRIAAQRESFGGHVIRFVGRRLDTYEAVVAGRWRLPDGTLLPE